MIFLTQMLDILTFQKHSMVGLFKLIKMQTEHLLLTTAVLEVEVQGLHM